MKLKFTGCCGNRLLLEESVEYILALARNLLKDDEDFLKDLKRIEESRRPLSATFTRSILEFAKKWRLI